MKRTPIVIAGLLALFSGCEKHPSASSPAATTRPAEQQAAAEPDGWIAMETLQPGHWQPINGAAELGWDAASGVLQIHFGNDLNGVRWTGPLPTAPYELELEARRISGNDFFCGLTFPVRSENESVTFVVGGWGGDIVGISSIDGLDASENSTASMQQFETGRWYRLRVRVEHERLQAWIDDRPVVDADILDRRLSLREGPIEDCAPLGLASWATLAEMRGMRWRQLAD
ncbi:MAG: family 16 glycoside hydrolase [Luteolibacter sp.]